MSFQTQTLDEIVASVIEELAKTASERDKIGGTAKEQRDFIRKSGLLTLDADWQTILSITRKIATIDSSLAHLIGYHYLCQASVELYGSPKQVTFFKAETSAHQYFWGNAFNPLDTHVKAEWDGDSWIINGTKSFCSGASDSDRLLISAQKIDGSGPLIAVIPTNRQGIFVHDDWDSFGQRQTDSGKVTFDGVKVAEEETLTAYEAGEGNLFATVRTHIAQSILVHVLLGTAEGAFDMAKNYTLTQTRPWVTSHVEEAGIDPYHLYHYGELYVKLQAASALAAISTKTLDDTWQLKQAITPQQRGACSIAVATAKVQVSQTALDVTSTIFQMMGARATSAKYNFDRYWRNVRTHTLHDPIDYKIRDLGQFTLHQQYPEISAYS